MAIKQKLEFQKNDHVWPIERSTDVPVEDASVGAPFVEADHARTLKPRSDLKNFSSDALMRTPEEAFHDEFELYLQPPVVVPITRAS